MSHGFAHWSAPFLPFAGPAATIIASLTAAGVAATFGLFQYKLGKSQRDIAQSQRDIAHEKLRADLFDRRMKVYSAARSVCLYIGRTKRDDVDFYKIREDSAVMEDSIFLFSKNVFDYILDLREQMLTYGANGLTLSALRVESDDYGSQLAEMQKSVKVIMKSYDELPKIVSPDMRLLSPQTTLTPHI